MPGTPDPLLGSELVNWIVAFLTGLVLVIGPLRFRGTLSHRRIAAASGAFAAAVGLALWALPRLATGAFAQFSWPDPVVAAALYAAGTLVLALQVAGPVYAHLEHGLVAPLAVGVGATTLAFFLFFQLGGETESFSLYALFTPFVLGALLAAVLLEAGVRRLVAARASPG